MYLILKMYFIILVLNYDNESELRVKSLSNINRLF